MRAFYLAGTAAAAVTILSPAISYADCREDIAAFDARLESAKSPNGPALTADERNDIAGMRSSAETFASSGDEQTCQRLVGRADTMLSAALDPQVVKPEQLEGLDVRGPDDEDLGKVEEVRLDPRTGQIAYLMVEYGGFAGVGEELAALPWALVHTAPGEDFVNVDVTKKQIESAPRWSEDIAAETTARDWAMSVHSFYGVAPYWRSQTSGGGSSSDDAETAGQSGGQASSANAGQSGGEGSSASAGQSGGAGASSSGAASSESASTQSEGAGSDAQTSGAGAKEVVASIDRLVEEISELRVVLTKSLENDQNASSGQAAGSGAKPGSQSNAAQTSQSGAGEQPAEDGASAGGESDQSRSSQSEGAQSGGAQSGSAQSEESQSEDSQSEEAPATGSNQSSGQSGAAAKQDSGSAATKSESGGADASDNEDK